MNSSVSIRRSLLGNLIVMILLLSVAIQGTMFLAARRIVRTLSAALIEQTLDQTEAQLRGFFDPVTANLELMRAWGEAGLLVDENPIDIADDQLSAATVLGGLNDLLVPVMQEHPQISSLLVADGHGREHMVLHVDDTWSVRKTRRDLWGDEVVFVSWSDTEPQLSVSRRRLDYDPRDRPWYQSAVQRVDSDAGELAHWTEPYIFFTTQDPGITTSLQFDLGDGREHVIGIDVLLTDITEFTQALRPSENGVAFVMTQTGEMIGLPRHDRLASDESRRLAMLKRPLDLNIASVADGAQAYWALPADSGGAYRFFSDGQAWWGGARPYSLGGGRDLVIAVGVPESDLLRGLVQVRLWIIVITLGVLVGAVLRAIVMARQFSRPIEVLVRQSERISQGDLEPGESVDTNVREVRRLARAHDRMRQGLQTLMKLERDLQLARQIQQNTFPQSLPVLSGYEIDAWSEPADETGGDSYDVIGYTYDLIGCEQRGSATEGARLVDRADRAVFLLADATGHGIGPALSVTQVRAMLRMAVRMGKDLLTIVRHLNDQLCADLPDNQFITAWLGELNAREHRLTSFSAGQAPLLYYDAARDAVEVINADMPPFGVLDDLKIQLPDPIDMKPGDIFAVISDGVFEAVNDVNEQFGLSRVSEVLSQQHRSSPSQIMSSVRAALAEFTGVVPAADDRTAIILKRTSR